MRRLVILVLGLTLVVALGACGSDDDDGSAVGGSDDAASSGLASDDSGDDASTSELVDDGSGGAEAGAPPDGCSLLTLDDVAAAGLAATSGPTPTEGARFSECTFADADGQTVLQVQVFGPDDAGGAISDEVSVSGIGEAAKYSPGFRSLTIDLSDGSQIVLYSPPAAGPDDPESVLVELGRIATG